MVPYQPGNIGLFVPVKSQKHYLTVSFSEIENELITKPSGTLLCMLLV
jgi:hypothetical protein